MIRGDTGFLDEVKRKTDESDRGQMITCPGRPGEGCGSNCFAVSVLARMGPEDAIGVFCAKCGYPVIDADVNDASDGVRKQLEIAP